MADETLKEAAIEHYTTYRAVHFGMILETEFEDQELSSLQLLLADARHFCDLHGWDYAEIDRGGYRQYAEEIGKEGIASAKRR